MYTDIFIVHVKIDDIDKGIARDFETRFDTSNNELEIPLSKVKDKKVIELMKDELGGKMMAEFLGLRAKTCKRLINYGSEDKKKQKAQKSVSYKESLNLKIIKTN